MNAKIAVDLPSRLPMNTIAVDMIAPVRTALGP